MKLQKSGGAYTVGVPGDLVLLMRLQKGDELIFSRVDDATMRVDILRQQNHFRTLDECINGGSDV